MYPVTYAADYAEKRSRLTTFFRYFMVIPQYIVGIFWAVALFFTAIAAWVMVSITGKYPPGLYDFNGKALRFLTRLNSYFYLTTDTYPPFGGDDDPAYPVRIGYAPPAAEYSRLKAFFRLIVGIPVLIMLYLYAILLGLVGLVSWVVIVVTGKQPKGLQDLLVMALSYSTKGNAYMLLMTERYPPITETPQLESGPSAPAIGS